MSLSLESGDARIAPDLISLAEAAVRLGCHVETLRLRVRNGRLPATRGPHGRYCVRVMDLERLPRPRRMRRRRLDGDALAAVQRRIEEALGDPQRLMGWQRQLVVRVRDDSRSDLPLFRVMAARALLADGYNRPEIALLLGTSVRQVYRLLRSDLMVTLARSWRRQQRAESGRLRRQARSILAEIQRRLVASGFRPAWRAYGRRDGEGQGGQGEPVRERVALVRNLTRDQRRDLLRAGLEHNQVLAISMVGIGADELNELLLRGVP